MSVNKKMTAIADTIRSHTGGTDKLFLDDMPLAIETACTAEYEKGLAEGQASGQVYADRIWEAIQKGGTRTFYDQMLGGIQWTDAVYHPKYDIKCEGSEGARETFIRSNITSTKVPIRCKNTRLAYTFAYCFQLKTIPLLTLEGITQINNAFTSCVALEDITMEGEIPLSINFQHSTKLTKESITSIINALSDTASGQTLTLSQTAVDTAFYSDEMLGSDTGGWASLVNAKPNWIISLV